MKLLKVVVFCKRKQFWKTGINSPYSQMVHLIYLLWGSANDQYFIVVNVVAAIHQACKITMYFYFKCPQETLLAGSSFITILFHSPGLNN